jgi:alkanesulfonate monooxygenase SsuD/methylene tetrahydromethanopterin reductase-like flavin-dependent oxidoreductase (luciferase family)
MTSLKDFGIMLEPQLGMTVQGLVETARRAEELGFGFLFRSDHLLPTNDRRGIDSPECWTSLGAVAASTSKIRFGPMVTPISFRNPALLGKMALTLHSYSNGRLRLGLGAGWYEAEYHANGYEFPSFAVRIGQFSEALEIIHTMARMEKVEYDGKYFSAHTDCFPRPKGKLHLIIGGRSKAVVKMAALYADEWNYFTGEPGAITQRRALLESGGRRVEISETGPFAVGRTQSELESHAQKVVANHSMRHSGAEYLARLRKNGSPCGTMDEFAEQIGRRVDSGTSKFYFQLLVPEDPAMMELLAEALGRQF